MEQVDLTPEQQRVYEKLAELEEEHGGVREDELSRATELERPVVTEALRALVREHDLVRELPAAEPDLGPHYRVKDTAASG